MGNLRKQAAAEALGRLVREQRKAVGLSQEELAVHAGVGVAFLYNLERGKRTLRLDKVLAVLEVLGLVLAVELARPGTRGGSVVSRIPGGEA